VIITNKTTIDLMRSLDFLLLMSKLRIIASLILVSSLNLFAQKNQSNSGYNHIASDNKTPDGLNIDVGTGFIYGPNFLGSKENRLNLVPLLKLMYGTKFSISYDGIRYDLVNADGFTGGVIGKVAFERRENDNTPFSLTGSKSKALLGLGNIPTSFEVGVYGGYTLNSYKFNLEILQGVSGKNEFIGNIGIQRTEDIHEYFYSAGPPLIWILGFGTRLVNSNYNNQYFGVNALQAARSGLSQYKAKSGFVSYGFDNNFVLPITQSLAAVTLLGYDRLIGSAASSPLVVQRGSKNQFRFALFFVYKFENILNY
jgi:outer membrane protein